MNHSANKADIRPPPRSGILHSHFNVMAEAPQRQLLAWRDRVAHLIDVLPSSSDLERPFRASIDRYQVCELVLTYCRFDQILLERSLARISTDKARDFVFHVFLEGGVGNVSVRAQPRESSPSVASILALDMSQPVRMQRHACRMLTFFVPGALVEEVFPDPEAIHGRTIHGTTPLTQLVIEHVTALSQNIVHMSADAAERDIRAGAQLLAAVFGKQALLSGNARAAARAVMFGLVRRYVQAHLHEAELSPEGVLNALQLPRSTLYRLFQQEGGLGAYIRHLRLRRAADMLARNLHMTVTDIAYELGFKSSSDFARAFRRAYGMTPRDFQALSGSKAA